MNPITIVVADTQHHRLTRLAIGHTIKCLPMPVKVLTFSNAEIISGETRVPILEMKGRLDYNEIILKHLWPFVDTDHFLIVQYDGMAINRDAWTDEFLSIDYIGAAWKGKIIDNKLRVGNGGFSLRSRKLLDALRDPTINMLPTEKRGLEEDRVIADYHRGLLETKYQINFASYELCSRFSYESGPIRIKNVFRCHGIWNVPFYFSEDYTLDVFSDIKTWPSYSCRKVIEVCQEKNYQEVLKFLEGKRIL